MAHSTCRASTTSKLAAGSVGAAASDSSNRALTPAALALARAALIICGAKSSPVTAYPSAASSTDSVPVPQPRSAIAAGAAGSSASSSRRHACLTRGSSRPWSGWWSKVAA